MNENMALLPMKQWGVYFYRDFIEIGITVMKFPTDFLEMKCLPKGCPGLAPLDGSVIDHPDESSPVLGHSEKLCGNRLEVEGIALVHSEIVVWRRGDGEVDGTVFEELHALHAVHVVDSISLKHTLTYTQITGAVI